MHLTIMKRQCHKSSRDVKFHIWKKHKHSKKHTSVWGRSSFPTYPINGTCPLIFPFINCLSTLVLLRLSSLLLLGLRNPSATKITTTKKKLISFYLPTIQNSIQVKKNTCIWYPRVISSYPIYTDSRLFRWTYELMTDSSTRLEKTWKDVEITAQTVYSLYWKVMKTMQFKHWLHQGQ